MSIKPEKNLQGIGGWLLFFAIGLVVKAIWTGLTLYNGYVPMVTDGTWELLTSPNSPSYHKLWAPLLYFQIIGGIAFLILSLVTLYFFIKESRYTPRLVIACILLAVAFILTDFYFFLQIPVENDRPIIARYASNILGSILGALIWVPYFLKSKRVKATFVR